MKYFIIFLILILAIATMPSFTNNAYAQCVAENEINWNAALGKSELVFVGTVTRLDNYDGPQKVTFFIHDVIKGEIDTQKYVLENSGLSYHDNDTYSSSSLDVDYKIGKTYKVYVENGATNRCTTKIATPPADYMWEPGPEDGNYYSKNPVYANPCDEGYGLSDGVCITLEEMNKDAPPHSEPPPEPENIIDERCGVDTVSIDGVCQVVKVEKTKTAGDDAPFFGFFVCLDDLISWIFGK